MAIYTCCSPGLRKVRLTLKVFESLSPASPCSFTMTSLVGKLQGVDCWIKIRNSALPALRTIWKFTEYRNPAFLAVGLVLSTAVWGALKRTFRQFISARTTVLLDLPNLGNSRPNEARIKGTAVVIGGR